MSHEHITGKTRVRATEKGKKWRGTQAPKVSIAIARSLDDIREGLESSELFPGLEVLERPRHPGVVVADAETTEEIKEEGFLSLTNKGDRSLEEGRVPPGVKRGTYDLVSVGDDWHLQNAEPDMLVCRPPFGRNRNNSPGKSLLRPISTPQNTLAGVSVVLSLFQSCFLVHLGKRRENI